jgi:REP element-mobilizing transposase RayT
MPRPTRVSIPGALCYVTSRALEGVPLFKDDRDYTTYLRLLEEYRGRYGFKVFGFVLLPDHLYLCLELAPGTTISSIMHALNSRYTKYALKRHGRTGHLFQERFKLTVVEKAPSLLRVTGYLHVLPQRWGLSQDPLRYRWSSVRSYGVRHPAPAGQAGGGVSDTGEVLEQLRQLRPGWSYELYLRSVPDAEWDLLEQELERPVVGSPEFLARVEQQRCQTLPKAEKVSDTFRAARPARSPAMTLSAAVALMALAASLLAARNVTFLKETMNVLAEENQQMVAALSAAVRGLGSGARLASWAVPRSLAGTSWDIRLKPALAAPGDTSLADRIQFEGDRMVSASLQKSGFLAGRYTSTLQKAGGMAWESVQVGPGGEVISWQGEQSGSTVRGVMTRQRPGEPVATFRFIGVQTTKT